MESTWAKRRVNLALGGPQVARTLPGPSGPCPVLTYGFLPGVMGRTQGQARVGTRAYLVKEML